MNKIDLLIYCPLDEEFEQVTSFFPMVKDLTELFDGSVVYESSANHISLIIACGDKMGVTPAISLISDIHEKIGIRNVVCLGIAGQIDTDLNIGDICYTGQNFDVTQSPKQTDKDIELTSYPYKTSPKITTSLNLFRKHPEYVQIRELFRASCKERRISLNLEHIEFIGDVTRTQDGSIVTGPVNASDRFKEKLKKMDRKFLAIETEVGGVFEYFERRTGVEVFTIRGISDLGDSTKNRFEAQTKGNLRTFAIQNATQFLLLNIQNNNQFQKAICGSTPAITTSSLITTTDLIQKLDTHHHQRLKLLSPEFQSQSENYWVPAPRIIDINAHEKSNRPVEILSALQLYKHVYLKMPISYPDRGAADLYALELLGRTNEDGEILIPLVIESKKLRPPKNVFEFASLPNGISISQITNLASCRVVIILRDIDVHSETLMRHVENFVSRDSCYSLIVGDPKYIFDQYEDSNLKGLWRKFSVSEVSFSNIAKFLRKNHQFDQVSSEALAIRLYDALSDYQIQPHPTYFAGMSREMLMRLLDANNRSELIELAVIGLTMLSASSDQNTARLSRTHRHEIIKNIVYEKHFGENNLSAQIVKDKFRKDLNHKGIDVSSDFLWDSLVNASLVTEYEGIIEIGVPFVESYILAEILLADNELASKYFLSENRHRDDLTFILFCEMGGAEAFYDEAVRRLSISISEFDMIIGDTAERIPSQHALLDKLLGPSILKSPAAIQKLGRGLLEQADRLLSSDSEIENKQKALDTQASIMAKIEEIEKPKTPDLSGRYQIASDLIFALAVLGGGAERLSGDMKRRLASDIIMVLDLIADDWFRVVQKQKGSTNFLEIIEAIKKDPELETNFLEDDNLDKFVEWLFEVIQSESYLSVLPSLFEQIEQIGCSGILRPIIRDAEAKTKTQRLFKSIWAALIDPKNNGNILIDSYREIPKNSFLRYTIATVLMRSAYWFARTENDRIDLLALAEKALEPLNLKPSKK